MENVFVSIIGQTWLLSAQIFSTREFAQLAVQRILPKLTTLFLIIFMPVGMVIDGTVLHFGVSIGIMGILYAANFMLFTKPWEHLLFPVTILLSLFAIDALKYGMVPYVFVCTASLAVLMGILSLLLMKYSRVVGVILSFIISILAEMLVGIKFGTNWDGLAVSVLIAVMSGLYVTYRSIYDKDVQDTHEAVQYDVLTKALTRRGLSAWLKMRSDRKEDNGMIVFCDLDNFKWINDTWGHEVGDRVLQEFVRRINQGLRQSDVIARFGGDEYQIWVPMNEPCASEQLVERLHELATEGEYKVLPDGAGLKIGVSMGWTYGQFSDEKANEADFALLEAKKFGKNRVCQATNSGLKEAYLYNQTVGDDDPHLYWLKNITQSLWSEVHYPFVLTDKSGKILFANEAYEQLVGRKLSDLLGNKPGINSAKKTPRTVYQNMWSNLASGKPWSGCLLNRRADGTEWWELSELFPIILSGQIIGYWGLAQELANAKFPPAIERSDYKWHGGIEWAFQPIVDVNSQNVMGFEALVRPKWGNDEVGPDDFFAIAESFNFIKEADWECLESLLEKLQTMSWPINTRLFLNIFAETFNDKDRLINWLERFYKILPDTICVFEILEHHVDNIDLEYWNSLQAKFPLIELAQDDFGSGEDDLIRLVKAKPQWIKLDRQWVTAMSEHPESRLLLKSMVKWAGEEGIKLIIEGIETEEQSKLFSSVGVHHEQGYFWSKPHKVLYFDFCYKKMKSSV